jgi:hypothetical protein
LELPASTLVVASLGAVARERAPVVVENCWNRIPTQRLAGEVPNDEGIGFKIWLDWSYWNGMPSQRPAGGVPSNEGIGHRNWICNQIWRSL